MARCIEGHADRVVEQRKRRQSAVAAKAVLPVASDGVNDASGSHLTNPIVDAIGNEQIAGAIHEDPSRISNTRTYGRSSIAGVTDLAGTCNRDDGPIGLDLSNTHSISSVAEIDRPHGIRRYTARPPQRGLKRGAVVATHQRGPIAGDGRDYTGCIDAPNAIIVPVCDVDVPSRVHCDRLGPS